MVEFPKVSAITLNWNGKDDTIECIASLKKLNYPNYDIVVVDNGSTDGSVSALRAQYPDIAIIENGRNLGYAEGFNVGLKYAHENGADYFLIVNNDTIIDPDAMTALVLAAESAPDIGFVSGKVYWHNDPNRLQTAGRLTDPHTLVGTHVASGEIDNGQVDAIKEYDFIDDVFLLVRQSVYKKVGGYDPNFFLYFEETDWCARVRRAGFTIIYTPHAKIWHKGQVGGPSGALSPVRHYYLCRNEIVFMKKNTSPSRFLRYLLYALWQQLVLGSARWIKHGKFQHAFARLRGFGAGFVWLWQDWRGARLNVRTM